MRQAPVLAAALAAIAFGSAHAAVCQAGRLTCATTMPVGGYCECTSHGATGGGTVIKAPPKTHLNFTACGCGAQPSSPGCR